MEPPYPVSLLIHQSRWIRDELDLQVARDGPDALHSDELLRLDEFLRRLLDTTPNIKISDIRQSRIHLAIQCISGRATRWPKRLIDRCEALEEVWVGHFGPLKEVGTALYEPSGRLWGLSKPEDYVSKERVVLSRLRATGIRISPTWARRDGNLGFEAGSWWINPTFAFLDGIIDRTGSEGGITADDNGAYAVLMTNDDEIESTSPESFTYRAKAHGRGRYRLTSVSGPLEQAYGMMAFFKRLQSELPFETVLGRPWADEVEDYKEYKRQRQLARHPMIGGQHRAISTPIADINRSIPTVTTTHVDGSTEMHARFGSPRNSRAPFVNPDQIAHEDRLGMFNFVMWESRTPDNPFIPNWSDRLPDIDEEDDRRRASPYSQ
ncbi:Hypothetical protein R9X50_00630000 [Acrodontium crateriforme]|uniref:Uncharacterized protein n=1 Tax=Acrodontium crateriforme TaxID=150365 RepID=A0AAQ3RC34_9PEZI|nr:Hypothetical protein R9X50_00630000 [Acrodontium crateriforme]